MKKHHNRVHIRQKEFSLMVDVYWWSMPANRVVYTLYFNRKWMKAYNIMGGTECIAQRRHSLEMLRTFSDRMWKSCTLIGYNSLSARKA